MDLRTYQERARKTDRKPGTDEQARMIPLAGLASETGELLGEYKKYLRDGESHQLFSERLAEEVGDLLWYVANVATKFGLDLAQVAGQNLAKCEGCNSRSAFTRLVRIALPAQLECGVS